MQPACMQIFNQIGTLESCKGPPFRFTITTCAKAMVRDQSGLGAGSAPL